ncbi:MAG: type II CAAX endopeptidase family protein [Chloroflexota bacterium]
MHVHSGPPPIPWQERDVWLGMSSFAVWIATIFGLRFVLEPEASSSFNVGLLVSLGELILLIPVWFLTLYRYRASLADLGLRPFFPVAIGIGCLLMVLSFAFNLLYASLLSQFGQRMQQDLVPIFAELSSPWLFFLGGAVIAPVVEEIFFRGFVFAGLRPRYGWKMAAVISAGLFAVLHFTLNAIIPIFILGVIFSYLYETSGSIWPGIIMHTLTNTFALGGAYIVANAEQFGITVTLLGFLGY